MSNASADRATRAEVGGLATGMAAGLALGFASHRPAPLPRTGTSFPDATAVHSAPAPVEPTNRRDLAPHEQYLPGDVMGTVRTSRLFRTRYPRAETTSRLGPRAKPERRN